jgi:large subunit ribosomal protein L15
VNVADLAQLAEQSEVTPDVLCEMGLIEGRKGARLKVLGKGEIGVALTVRAHAFSDTARRKILDAGGNVEEMSC